MRTDATFIAIEVSDTIANDPAIAAKLAEVCPVDIYTTTTNGVAINQDNIDECVLCQLCIHATPTATITIHKLYDTGPHATLTD